MKTLLAEHFQDEKQNFLHPTYESDNYNLIAFAFHFLTDIDFFVSLVILIMFLKIEDLGNKFSYGF